MRPGTGSSGIFYITGDLDHVLRQSGGFWVRCRVLALSAIVPGKGTKSVIEVSAAFSFSFPLGVG